MLHRYCLVHEWNGQKINTLLSVVAAVRAFGTLLHMDVCHVLYVSLRTNVHGTHNFWLLSRSCILGHV